MNDEGLSECYVLSDADDLLMFECEFVVQGGADNFSQQ